MVFVPKVFIGWLLIGFFLVFDISEIEQYQEDDDVKEEDENRRER
jgi:hypothetical protein